MSGPWADYQAQPAADGPWADYAPPAPSIAAPAKPKGVVQNITGFMANVNRGLGIGDELAAGAATARDLMTGKAGSGIVQTYKDEMAHQRQIEDGFTAAHPNIAALGRGTGNALLIAAPAGPGAEAYAGGNLMTNAVRGATTAGLTGAAYGAADRGTMSQRLYAASRAARDPLVLGLGAAGGAVATARAAPKATGEAAPMLDQLTAAKDAAYKAVDDSGVRYSPEAMQGLASDINKTLGENNFNPRLHTRAAPILDQMAEDVNAMGGHSPTLTQLDQFRRQVRDSVAGSPDADERRIGKLIIGRIDNFINTAGPEALTGATDPAVAAETLARARDLNTKVQKIRALDDLDTAAENRASVTGSGGNINNATRQNVLRFMTKTGNLTPAEQAAAQKVVDGTPVGNLTRQVGKLSPEGNGLMTGVHLLGAVPSHGLTVAAAGVGAISKRISDAITLGNVAELRNIIASGGQGAREVSSQLSMAPGASELRRQLANDLAAQAGVQGVALQRPMTAGASR